MFAGKTGSSQIKRFTQDQREAEVKQKDLDFLSRDHALFIAFAPSENPQIVIAIVVENGGHGGSTAGPIAKEVFDAYLNKIK